MPIHVLHLVGSPTSELYADLSRLYAADCLAATADAGRYRFEIAYVAPDGRWRFPAGLERSAIDAARPMDVTEAIGEVGALGIQVMVPHMFCLPGMTTYRALFDLLGIPYVGNAPATMANAASKVRAKALVAAAGVRVPAGEVLRPGDRPSTPPPAVVKPVDADNSLGLGLVREPGDWDEALAEAFGHAGEVLVEPFVELGREVRCGIVERGGELVCLPLEEYDVDPVSRPIRGYADKLADTGGDGLRLVAKEQTKAWIVDPADPVTAAVWDAARRCHQALGCRHYSLFDFRIDPAGRPWFLEAGPYCSFARQSVVAMMAESAGIALADLFASLVAAAIGDAPGGQ